MAVIGIDIGSTTTKGVRLEGCGEIAANRIIPTGASPVNSGNELINGLSQNSRIEKIFVTGYGRGLFKTADKRITEITCHAAGIHHLYPAAVGIIDIGGQDSKAIHLKEDGSVQDFAMNDKCAAGTGSFLDNIANKFDIQYDSMLELYTAATRKVNINSTCVVFAESEIIGLLAQGEKLENIFKGVLQAIAMRIDRLYSQVKIPAGSKIYFTGGVAQNAAMQQALAEELQIGIIVDPRAQLMGALGAAVLALKSV